MLSSGKLLKQTSENLSTKKSKQASISLLGIFSKIFSVIGLGFILIYRAFFGFWFGGSCRFEPSCSDYGYQAFKKFSFLKASKLTINRILRCRPGSNYGYDPLPEERRHG